MEGNNTMKVKKKERYSPTDIAKVLGRGRSTMDLWAQKKKIVFHRDPLSNYRYLTLSELKALYKKIYEKELVCE